MTEEEFALSLPQDISDNERTRRLEEWRKENPQPEVEEEVEEVVEEKPIPLTIASATEPVKKETPVFSIEKFTKNIKSPDFNDLSTEQKLRLQEYAAKEIEKEYDESDDYSISQPEITLKTASIFQNEILPKVSFDKLNATEVEKFTDKYVPVLNPVADFLGDIWRAGKQGYAQSGVVDPVFELFKNGGNVSDKNIQAYLDANKEASSQMQSDEMRSFGKIYKENGKGVYGFLKGVIENPTILPTLLVSSVATQAGSLRSDEVRTAAALAAGTGAAAGSLAGPGGTVTGGMAGLIGGGAASMEAALTFSELLQEEVGEDLDKDKIRVILEDPKKLKDLKTKARNRGIAIGVIEGLTGGLAKGITGKAVKAGLGKPTATTAGLAVEAIGGGTGEVAGRIAADQEMDVAEIGFEAVTGLSTAPITVGSEVINIETKKLNNSIANYQINKEIKGTNFVDIEAVFEPTNEISEAAINLSQNKRVKSVLENKLKQSVIEGKITPLKAVEIQTQYRDIEGATQKLNPIGLGDNTEANSLVVEKNKLTNIIKQVDDSALTQEETVRVNEINTRLSELAADAKAERANVVGMSILPTRKSSPKADELATQYQQDPSAVDVEALLDQYNKIGLAAIKFDTRKGDMAREDAIAEINKEFAGIMDRWSPDKGSFSTFVTANIAPKAQGIYDKYIGQKDATTLDRPEAREVVAEEVDVDVTRQETGRAKVYPVTLEVITENVTPEVRSEQTVMVKDDINRAVATVSTSPKVVAKNLVDQIKTKEYRQLLKNKLGKWNTEQYNNNVDRLITKDFVATIPVAQLKRRFPRLFEIEVIDRVPTVKIEDGKRTDFKKPVYKIPAITDAKLETIKEYFKDNEKRHQSLMEVLGEGIAIEQMQELRGDQAFMTDLQGRLELKGSDLTAEQFLNEVEFNLDKRNLEDRSLDVLETEVVEKAKPKAKPKKESLENINIKAAEKNIGEIVGSQIGKIKIQKEGRLTKIREGVEVSKDNSVRNLDETVPGTSETFESARDRIINEFLKEFPQWREAIRRNSTTGIDRSFFLTTGEFDTRIDKTKTKQVVPANKKILKGRKLNPNGLLEVDTKEFKDKQLEGVNDLVDLYKDFALFLQNNPKQKNVAKQIFGEIISDSTDATNGIFRLSAIYGFYPVLENGKQNTLDPITAEHTKPNMSQQRPLTNAMLESPEAVEAQRDIVAGSYMQGGFLKFDDDLVNKDYKFTMPEVYYTSVLPALIKGDLNYLVKKYPGIASWIRPAVSGANPNFYKSTFDNKIITEVFGVEVEGDLRFYPDVVENQNKAIIRILSGENKAQVVKDFKASLKADELKSLAALNIQDFAYPLLQRKCTSPCRVPKTSNKIKDVLINSGKAKANAQKVNKETKGLSAFDMDDTLALTKEKVLYRMPDGKTGELTAGEFAVEAENLTEQGAEFDFTNFENVDLSTPKGPLAGEALKKQAKYGSKDIYVVTARPGAAQESIKLFLDSIGLNIPLKNIITLEDGSPQAKADWVISKAEQGYNDFYFADDSALNVDTVQKILDQIDVKSKTQIAIADKAKRLDTEFNKQIEDVTGKEDFKKYSDARARLEGKQKDKGVFKRFINQFTITPSADDFMGLMYAFMGKGKQGNKHAQFIKENLMDPYNKAEQELLSSKVTVANDFAALREAFPTLKSKRGKNPLMEEIGIGPYTRSQAIRVYMWNKQGMEIPGMSQRDIDALVAAVESDLELKPFADNVMLVQKNKQYPAPGANWLAGDITTDILKGLDTTYRKELMTEFNENVDIIFSKENLNKIEAIYGSKFRESLVDSLRRMKTGSNRPVFVGSGSRIVNEMMDWLNSSVGAVMFLNMRSGLLQLISNVNFINWGDNNIYNAAKAFTSKDYFPTVLKLLNSDYLVNRRDGLKINVNEAELADAGRQGGIKGMINYILDKGFAITRVMDSVAIATGGATFFINRKQSLQNRVNPETGKLYTEQEADTKTFDDFYAIAEETQQSSNPSRISQQQASLAGRVILSFQNVTMQYNRKTKKSIQDLYNRRTKPGMTQRESDLSNLSSVMYYVAVQNLVFNALQQALFALAFDDEPEEKDKDKAANIANGMLDSLLFGLGFGGAIVSTVKNVAMKIADESEKKSTQYRDVVWSVFDISPVLDSKVRKLRTAAKTFDWNMDEIKKRGWSLDNPAYLAISQIISASTNLPLDRVLRKAMNVGQAFDEETKTWQRVALLLGWSGWNLDLPYWGRESTIKKEEATEARIKEKYSIDVRKMKSIGFTKRVPLTGPNSGKPSGKLGVDYIQLERPDGKIQYYKKP